MSEQHAAYHIALTGHRPAKLGGYNLQGAGYQKLRHQLKTMLASALAVYDQIACRSGLALGADTIWSQAVLETRNAYPGRVSFIADVPTPEQASEWPDPHDQWFWLWQIHQCDILNVHGTLAGTAASKRYQQAAALMHKRNHVMVDGCDHLIAVFDEAETSGGTAGTVAYARRQHKPVTVLHPAAFFG